MQTCNLYSWLCKVFCIVSYYLTPLASHDIDHADFFILQLTEAEGTRGNLTSHCSAVHISLCLSPVLAWLEKGPLTSSLRVTVNYLKGNMLHISGRWKRVPPPSCIYIAHSKIGNMSCVISYVNRYNTDMYLKRYFCICNLLLYIMSL